MMQAARQMGGGIFYALISVLLVVGGLSLALAEGNNSASPASTPSLTALPPSTTPIPSMPFPQPGSTATDTLIPLPIPTQTLSAPANCIPPSGWILIIVQPGESLSSLAARYQITPGQLEQANCLSTQNLSPGYGVFVPPQPTTTAVPCGPFPGWIRGYVVQPGDTLFHIATIYRTTVGDMDRANCKSNSTIIFAGDRLWVPNVPTITPGVTLIPIFDTATEIPTEPLTLTPLPLTDAPLPTNTTEPTGSPAP
jgi:LysM repeat protein